MKWLSRGFVALLLTTFLVLTASAVSVTTLTPTDNPDYASKYFVTETNAQLVTKIQKPYGSDFGGAGVRLYKDKELVVDKFFPNVNVGKNSTTFHTWCDFQLEANTVLTPGTTYEYYFYAIVDDQRYNGQPYAFTTLGTAPGGQAVVAPDLGETSDVWVAMHCACYDSAGNLLKDTVTELNYRNVNMTLSAYEGVMPYDVRADYDFTREGDVITFMNLDGICNVYCYYELEQEPTPESTPEFQEKDLATAFPKEFSYKNGQFPDVGTRDWCYENVKTAYELGLMKGDAQGNFAPLEEMTVAEAMTLAARVHNTYFGNKESFSQQEGYPWYQPYIMYIDHYAMHELQNYTAAITREEFAYIMSSALPDEALPANGYGTDFSDAQHFRYGDSITLLNRAGVISGYENGCFYAKNTITRAEAATILTRMVCPELRLTPQPGKKVYLEDLTPYSQNDRMQDQVTMFPKNIDNYGNTYLNGIFYTIGWGLVGDIATVEYYLDGDYTTLGGVLFVPECSKAVESDDGAFWVYGDDKLLYHYEGLQGKDKPLDFTVDISGVDFVRIQLDGHWTSSGMAVSSPLNCLGNAWVEERN